MFAQSLFLCLLCLRIQIPLTAADAAPSQESRQEYINALGAAGHGDYEKAIQILAEIIRTDPGFPPAYIKIADIFRIAGTTDRGFSFFRNLLKNNPENAMAFFGMGCFYQQNGKSGQALENFRQTLKLAPHYAPAYKNLVDMYFQLHREEEAFRSLTSLSLSDSTNAACWFGLGYWHQKKWDWDKALSLMDKALDCDNDLLEVYMEKSAIYWYTSRFQKFLETCETGIDKAKRDHDIESQCRLLNNAGLAHIELADYQEALNDLTPALEIAVETGLKTMETSILINTGLVHERKAQYRQAREYYMKARRLAEESKDRNHEALILYNIGMIDDQIDDYTHGLACCEEALTIAREVKDEQKEALILWGTGIIYWHFCDYKSALTYLESALIVYKKAGNKKGIGKCYNMMGLIQWTFGKYSQALRLLDQSLSVAGETGDLDEQTYVLGNMAIIYDVLGDRDEALEFYSQALQIAQKIGNRSEEARNLGNMGSAYHGKGDFTAALQYYQQALKIAQEIDNKKVESDFLGNIGDLYLDLGNFDSAKACLQKSLRIAREIGEKRTEAQQLNRWGRLFVRMGDTEQALPAFSQALDIGQTIQEPGIIWKAHEGIAEISNLENDYQKSIDHLELAVAEIEKTRNQIFSETFKTQYQETIISVYKKLIRILAACHQKFPLKGYDRKAFYYTERVKARALLDIVFEGKLFHELQRIPSGFSQKFLLNTRQMEVKHQALSEELNRKERDKNWIFSLENEITRLTMERGSMLDELKQNYPEYYSLTNPEILTLDEIQRKILHDGQCLIEYELDEDRIQVFLITKDHMELHTIPLSRNDLEKKLSRISPLFSEDNGSPGIIDHRWSNIQPADLKALYDILLKDAAAGPLFTQKELIIVPDGILYYFPFEILVTQNTDSRLHYLIEKFPISYAASASLMNPELIQNREPEKELLAFGNPDFQINRDKPLPGWIDVLTPAISVFRSSLLTPLPDAGREVKQIGRLFRNSLVCTGKKATETNFKKQAGEYRLIHLASHHILFDKEPMYSKIVLAKSGDEDGFLQTYEIYNLNLNAEMVVLSGCSTGLGKLRNGEGLINMTRAFMAAGVPATVVSLWPVHDGSTARFMQTFYRNLKTGMSKTRALQKAKIEFIRSDDFEKDPFYWGAFILTGNTAAVFPD